MLQFMPHVFDLNPDSPPGSSEQRLHGPQGIYAWIVKCGKAHYLAEISHLAVSFTGKVVNGYKGSPDTLGCSPNH